MEITIRDLDSREVAAATDLAWEVFMEFDAPDYSPQGRKEFQCFLANPKEINKLRFLGAFTGDKLAGILAMRQDHISLLFVAKEFHRQGIARSLFGYMLSEVEKDRITVNSSPYALEIYGKLGFTATSAEQITNGIRYIPMMYTSKGYRIERGVPADSDELEKLYDDLNDYLLATVNYPGWIKGIYPTGKDAARGIDNHTLYVVRQGGKIAGSVILNHRPEEAYDRVKWKVDADYSRILVIRTLAVHPSFLRMGIGRALMDFSVESARKQGMRSIRLDVYEKNFPAIALYERCGFEYIGLADLGLGEHGLNWFRLYEKVL